MIIMPFSFARWEMEQPQDDDEESLMALGMAENKLESMLTGACVIQYR